MHKSKFFGKFLVREGAEVKKGQELIKLDVGVIIPPDFPRKLAQKTAEIQVFIDGVNANTAGIAAN